MERFSLKSLEAFLNKEGYRSLFLESTEESVYPKLALFVGVDSRERERMVEITMKDQIEMNARSHKPESGHYCTLHFQFTFPFRANDLTLIDTARLVAFLNRNFEMPGLEYDEISGTLLYRHSMLLNKNNVDMESLTITIGMIMLFVELFSDPIEQVALGKMTTNEILESVALAGAAQTFI